jgi:hypothetical protein
MTSEYEKCLIQEISDEVKCLKEVFAKNGLDENNPVARRVERIGVLTQKILNPEANSAA